MLDRVCSKEAMVDLESLVLGARQNVFGAQRQQPHLLSRPRVLQALLQITVQYSGSCGKSSSEDLCHRVVSVPVELHHLVKSRG